MGSKWTMKWLERGSPSGAYLENRQKVAKEFNWESQELFSDFLQPKSGPHFSHIHGMFSSQSRKRHKMHLIGQLTRGHRSRATGSHIIMSKNALEMWLIFPAGV